MRVLLVEDELDLGEAIKQVLTHQAYVVDWVTDGNQAWKYLEEQSTQYTLIIFDWLLPGLSGVDLCKRLRTSVGGASLTQNNSVPILMLTAKARMEEKIIGLDAGADDYLVKPFGMAELLARLRALRRRSPQIQPQLLHIGSLTLNYATRVISRMQPNGDKQVILLTNKEFQLLEYFMKHPDLIITQKQIMNQLWEVDTEPMSNVVAAQIRLLRRKLDFNSSDCLIETIYGVGYRLKTCSVSDSTVTMGV